MSLASGRAIDVRVRLGDEVQQGQLLMRIKSADISAAFSDYRHAVADEVLARAQLDRAKALYERGAIAQKDLEVAQDAEDKAVVDVETTAEHLRVLGVIPQGPPTQHRRHHGARLGRDHGSAGHQRRRRPVARRTPNLFTISDLSHVWIVCDVYENDLATVHLGDTAEIRLNAYPDRMLTGRVSNIRHPRSEHPHRQGSHRSAESRTHASRHVCHGHLPRPDHGNAHRGARLRHPAYARPRLCLRARAGQANSAAWKSSAETPCPTTCRTSSPGSSQASRWWRMRWSWSTRSTNK